MFVLKKKEKGGSTSVMMKGVMMFGYFAALRGAYLLFQAYGEGNILK